MLNAVQAGIIVDACIRQAVGFGGPIQGHNKLREVGIVDPDAREALNDVIVTFPNIGVLSRDHRLEPDDLTFTIDTTVVELRVEVRQKAVPIAAPATTSATSK